MAVEIAAIYDSRFEECGPVIWDQKRNMFVSKNNPDLRAKPDEWMVRAINKAIRDACKSAYAHGNGMGKNYPHI